MVLKGSEFPQPVEIFFTLILSGLANDRNVARAVCLRMCYSHLGFPADEEYSFHFPASRFNEAVSLNTEEYWMASNRLRSQQLRFHVVLTEASYMAKGLRFGGYPGLATFFLEVDDDVCLISSFREAVLLAERFLDFLFYRIALGLRSACAESIIALTMDSTR